MKAKFQQKIILNYIMVNPKENLNIVFKTTFQNTGNETELSKYTWQLKDESKNYNIRWKIFMYARPYKCDTRRLRSVPKREICHFACRSGIFTKQEN